MIRIERIYNNPIEDNSNSFRILIDRLWPRGLSKDKVKIDLWLKDIAPSSLLRKWFSHDKKNGMNLNLDILKNWKKIVNLLLKFSTKQLKDQ